MTGESTGDWPTRIARLAVAPDDEVEALARDLERLAETQPPDAEQARILAAVYPRLRAYAADAVLTSLAAKVYLSNWSSNRTLFERAAPLVEALATSGCGPVLLKGAALLSSVYRDLGVRALSDVDLLVDPRCVEAAWQILLEHGGAPERRGALAGVAQCWMAGHAWAFTFPGGWAIDLHWSPLVDCCAETLADRFRAHAEPASLNGVSVLVPAREHLLLHACVHGVRRDWLAPGRWLIDAATLVWRTPGLKWTLVSETAHEAGLGLALRSAWRSLEAVIPLPDDEGASHWPQELIERLEWWAWRLDRYSFHQAPLPRVITHLSRYRRLRRYHPGWRRKGWRDYWALHRAEKAPTR